MTTKRPARYTPLITEEQAREIVICRLEEASRPKGPTPLRLFAREMYECGLARRVPSVPLLSKLFAGDLYPHLCDRDGKPFVWDQIPRATRGRRSGAMRRTRVNLHALRDEVVRLGSIVRELCERIGVDGYEPPTRAGMEELPPTPEELHARETEEARELRAHFESMEPPTETRTPERAPAEPGDGTAAAALTLDDLFDTPQPPPPQATQEPTMHVVARAVPPPRRT